MGRLDFLYDGTIPPEYGAIQGLGGRCASKTCHWHNDDGTTGCTDRRALHFHHTDGGGTEERKAGKDSKRSNAYEIIRFLKRGHTPRFELLCATCHEIETSVSEQRRGANDHKQPALIRRSQQTEGLPERRVRNKAEMELEKAVNAVVAAMKRDKPR